MAGKTSGADLVDGLEGSDQAKAWLRTIVETLQGHTSVVDAALSLHCNQAYFYKVRGRSMQAMLRDLEPKRPGRKPREPDPRDDRIRQLEDELRRAKGALEAASARVTVALAVPQATRRPKGRSRAHPTS